MKRILWSMALSCCAPVMAAPAHAETITVFAAGSLRGVVAKLTPQAAAMGIEIKPTFDGAGTLRQRIEAGATPDLFLSADMTAPMALAAKGRAVMAPVAFARNRLCLLARGSLGMTGANMVARLMRRDVRIRTSRPVADPSGDYAMAMFDRMDHAHPGAGPALRAKAMAQLDAPLPPIPAGQNATAALLSSGAVDVAVTYCSATAPVLASAPDLVSVSVPDAFDPDPLFALALLSNRADAARFALLLLSQTGQEAIAQAGLLRLTRP